MRGREIIDVRASASTLGGNWSPNSYTATSCDSDHFVNAVRNIVENPEIMSPSLLRADLVPHAGQLSPLPDTWLANNPCDFSPRIPSMPGLTLNVVDVMRLIPRNPLKDPVTNLTVTYWACEDRRVIVLMPHLLEEQPTPWYLPQAKGTALSFDSSGITIEFQLYPECEPLNQKSPKDRIVRMGMHLAQTAAKHGEGLKNGYEKRVHHDTVVDRSSFQNRYLLLKEKYAANLVQQWAEKTNPTKHVFEDLGVAAFLIELWKEMYSGPDDFQFLDLGCGNGLLVHILSSEGYHGRGVDARKRRSWDLFATSNLETKIVMPACLDPDPESNFEIIRPRSGLFLIGNHSDELTLWLPLLGCPFVVIPCCSHTLGGERTRFASPEADKKSAYWGLVTKVINLAIRAGWEVELEWLRIPSTRNAAVIGRRRRDRDLVVSDVTIDTKRIIDEEGGADDFLTNARRLVSTELSH